MYRQYNPCVTPNCRLCAGKKTNNCPARCANIPVCPTLPRFRIQNLDSSIPALALHLDPHVINSWGMVIFGNQLWVANTGSNTITTYDLGGNKLLTVVSVPTPTGLAYNTSAHFRINNGITPSTLIVASLSGSLYGYNPMVNATVPTLIPRSTIANAIYTGIAIAGSHVYVADFGNGIITVFNSLFQLQSTVDFPFVDGSIINPLPSNFSPFNIVNIGNLLYVTYAPVSQHVGVPLRGQGNGYINIFTQNGTFVRRYISGGALNDPWAIISPPNKLCLPRGSILVGNDGDGLINVYNDTGSYLGTLTGTCMECIKIDNLKGLAFSLTYPRLIYYAGSNLVGVLVEQQYAQNSK